MFKVLSYFMQRPLSSIEKRLLEQLQQLTSEEFLAVFRHCLNMKQYPYSDKHVMQDREVTALVLLADVSAADIKKALKLYRK